jgi:hypothetical protein
MRTLLLVGWLMVPIAALAYHYGPGQERSRASEVARLLALGERCCIRGVDEAAQAYDDAANYCRPTASRDASHPAGRQGLMLCRKLPEASGTQGARRGMEDDAKADAKVLADARSRWRTRGTT